MTKEQFYTRQKGFSLVEIILSVSIFGLFVSMVMGLYYYSLHSTKVSAEKNREILYAQEAIEAVRSIRNRDFSDLEDGTYGLAINSFAWELTGSNDTSGDLTREVTITTEDTYTKGIEVVVTNTVTSKSITLRTQISTWELETWLMTEQADFDAGTYDDLVSVDNSGGEVELANGANGDWCNPSLSLNAYNITGNGVVQEISVREGELFMATGQNASSPTVMQYDVTSDETPTISYIGDYDSGKANDIYVEGDYAYVSTDTNSKEVVILDISSTPFTEVGTYDTPGIANAKAVIVDNNVGFVSVGDDIYSFDLSSPIGSRTNLGSIALGGDVQNMVISGDYLYAAIDSSTRQMSVIDISSPASMSEVAYSEITAGSGVNVATSADGNELYLVTAYSAGADELHIINVSTKSGDRPVVGSYGSGLMDPTSVELVGTNFVAIGGLGGEHYQVVDISTNTAPVQCGGLLMDDIYTIGSIADFDGNSYAYVITDASSSELNVILGGPGGGDNYKVSGEYESEVYDALSDVNFYRLAWEADTPDGTDITFQVRSGDSSDLSAQTWKGPDGTDATYYTDMDTGVLGASFEGDRYVQYKAFFTGDGEETPLLFETRIYYR